MSEVVEMPRRKGRPKNSVKTEIDRRAERNHQLIVVESRKAAALELACEKLEEVYALLKGAGFKANHAGMKQPQGYFAPNGTAPPIVNPCKLCGQQGVAPDGTGSWLCAVHYQYEKGNAVEEQLAEQLLGHATTAPIVARPAPSNPKKVIINQNEAEASGQTAQQPAAFDPMKGSPIVSVLD